MDSGHPWARTQEDWRKRLTTNPCELSPCGRTVGWSICTAESLHAAFLATSARKHSPVHHRGWGRRRCIGVCLGCISLAVSHKIRSSKSALALAHHLGAQRHPLKRTPALQRPKNLVLYGQQEVLVPNLGQLEKYRLGPMHAAPQEKRIDIESDPERCASNVQQHSSEMNTMSSAAPATCVARARGF